MRKKSSMGGFLLALGSFLICIVLAASANNGNSKDKGKDSPAATSASNLTAQDDTTRLEGEKSFRSNCARCHAAPPRFSPRVTATIVRHMRVRATITAEEARLILHYMTQ